MDGVMRVFPSSSFYPRFSLASLYYRNAERVSVIPVILYTFSREESDNSSKV